MACSARASWTTLSSNVSAKSSPNGYEPIETCYEEYL